MMMPSTSVTLVIDITLLATSESAMLFACYSIIIFIIIIVHANLLCLFIVMSITKTLVLTSRYRLLVIID